MNENNFQSQRILILFQNLTNSVFENNKNDEENEIIGIGLYL